MATFTCNSPHLPFSATPTQPQANLKLPLITPTKLCIHNHNRTNKRNLSIRAELRDGNKSGSGGGGGGGDFFAGFLVGGAVFGTLAYIFAPQIRRSILNEDEYGFRRARKPIYYDEGLERTRETLNEKIRQLNSAIDNVSSRLRGGNNTPTVEDIPEIDAQAEPEPEPEPKPEPSI